MSLDTSVEVKILCNLLEGVLRVSYEIFNQSELVLLTYDGPSSNASGEWPDLSEQIDLFMQGADTMQLRLVRSLPPKGKRIFRIQIPAVYRLDPGEKRTAQFSLKLPLCERALYFPHYSDAKYEPKTVARIQLVIGFFVPTEDTKLEKLSGDIFRPRGPFTEQKYVSSSQNLEIEANIRTDGKFQRESI